MSTCLFDQYFGAFVLKILTKAISLLLLLCLHQANPLQLSVAKRNSFRGFASSTRLLRCQYLILPLFRRLILSDSEFRVAITGSPCDLKSRLDTTGIENSPPGTSLVVGSRCLVPRLCPRNKSCTLNAVRLKDPKRLCVSGSYARCTKLRSEDVCWPLPQLNVACELAVSCLGLLPRHFGGRCVAGGPPS